MYFDLEVNWFFEKILNVQEESKYSNNFFIWYKKMQM